MHRSKVAGLAALLCSITSATLGAAQANAAEGAGPVQIGVHGSTLGLGVNASVEVSETFAARALISGWGLDYEETESGNKFKGDLDLQSIGLVTDWYPFASGLRITGGVFLNNNEISAVARGDSLEIGGNSYDGKFDLRLDFESLAPYFGAGWTSYLIGDSGVSFSVDAGLLYQSSPILSASGTAGDCTFTLSSGGAATVGGCSNAMSSALKADLESEHADLSDDLEDFEWYPVLSIGVAYRF